MRYADDIERLVPADHVRQLVGEAWKYFEEANRLNEEAQRRERDNGRAADERTKRIAEAHERGWNNVARAVQEGMRDIASAIRDSQR